MGAFDLDVTIEFCFVQANVGQPKQGVDPKAGGFTIQENESGGIATNHAHERSDKN